MRGLQLCRSVQGSALVLSPQSCELRAGPPPIVPAGDVEALAAQHLLPEARCKASGVSQTTSQVTFMQVSG